MQEEIIGGVTAIRDENIIATEINLIKRQTAQQALRATVEIGRLLCEAKTLVPYGRWGEWLEVNVDYSQSTANNIMRIYSEYGEPAQMGFFEENRLEIFGSLTPSQAVALFALPQSERAAFVESHDMDNMSVRDIQAEIKELQTAKESAEQQMQDAENMAEKYRQEAENAKRLADQAKKSLEEECRRSREEIARVKKEAESKGQQTIAVPADETKIRAEIKAELEKDFADREKKLESAGKRELAKVQKEKRELAEKNARLEAQLTTAGAVAVQKFAIHFETLQNEFRVLQETVSGIRAEDPSQADKLEGVLAKILETMRATIQTKTQEG